MTNIRLEIGKLNREKEKLQKELDKARQDFVNRIRFLSRSEKKKLQSTLVNTNDELGANLPDVLPSGEGSSSCLQYYPVLEISSLSNEEFILVNKKPSLDSFNRTTPSQKLYINGDTASDFIFLNPYNLTDCRAIVDAPGLRINTAGNSYVSDPSLTIIANVAIEDYSILQNLGIVELATGEKPEPAQPGDQRARPVQPRYTEEELKNFAILINYLQQFIMPPIDLNRVAVKGSAGNQSVLHDTIDAKMATPLFIGIPLKSNTRVYGPWTDNPRNVLSNNLSNNLFGNIKVEQNNDYVPWKYGNMRFLQNIVKYNINYDVNYQTVLETGRVVIVGPPIFGIGGSFTSNISNQNLNSNLLFFDNNIYSRSLNTISFTDSNLRRILNYRTVSINSNNDLGFPIISNISIQTSSDGIKTSYSFQTYNPKTGLFNKELTDRTREINNRLSKFNKAINNIANKISSKNLLSNLSIVEEARKNREPYDVNALSTRFYGKSPVELIVGEAQQYLDKPKNIEAVQYTGIFYDIKQYHWAGIITGDETGGQLLDGYSSKSAMSLDGLLSPVSFYPTKKSGTYPISTLVTGGLMNPPPIMGYPLMCPKCLNKRYTEIYNRAGDGILTKPIKVPCSVCSKAKLDIKKEDKNPKNPSTPPDINIYSLNPIVVPSGEFSNPYALNGDALQHSILGIARGDVVQTNDTSFLIRDNFKNNNTNDFALYDQDKLATDDILILNNQRFMALRGPLMLHGWGFDTDGYPVPNENDMPYHINDDGLMLRFQLIIDPDNKKFGQNDLDKPGKFFNEPEAFEMGGEKINGPPLGDIITKQYKWRGDGNGIIGGSGKWSKKPKKSKYFYLNWAQKGDKWPVGPIDLRWDEKRRVWDASGGGCKEEILPPFIISDKNDISTLTEFLENRNENKCPYKMIYITLEQDMTKENNFESTNPARAFIDDIEYSKEPLQNNFRRLVYIIDTAGYTAPRGAKLLCRYNRDNGFYEPVTKPILTALGTISGLEAKIEMSYTQGRRSGVLPIFTTKFANPLHLTTGDKGLFNYINGQWTLVSTG